MRWKLAVVAALGASAACLGQTTEPINGMRATELRVHAIVDAEIVTAPGNRIERGAIVIRDGVIEAVGEDLTLPPEARIWSAEGLTIYPGLIDAAILADPAEGDRGPGSHWNRRIHPELSMADVSTPSSSVREALRKLGFTAAAVFPDSGVLRGSGVVVALADEPEHALAYADRTWMAAAFERGGSYPNSLMGSIALLRQTLYDAQWHEAGRRIWSEFPQGNEPPPRADSLVALEDVINGRQTMLFDVRDELDAVRAARIADEFGLDMILLGSGTEFRRLDEVRAAGVAIIVPLRFPDRPNVSTLPDAENVSLRDLMTWEQAATNPRRLVDSGATVALTTHRLRKRSDFYPNLASAIKHGLDEDAALAALTITPARLLGLDQILGSIEAGKMANLVVVEGSLFEKKPEIRDVWVNGRRHEISADPQIKLVSAGTLTTDTGIERAVSVDTTKKTVTVQGDEKKFKARKVVVQQSRLSFVVDGQPFASEGYVRLSGVLADEVVTGTGIMSDGSRFGFTIVPHEEDVDSESEEDRTTEVAAAAEENDNDDDVDDGISGVWSAEYTTDQIPPDSRAFTMTLELDDDDATVSGEFSSQFFSADITSASYNPDNGSISFSLLGDEFSTDVTAQISGDSMTGRMEAGAMNFDFTASRTAAVGPAPSDDEDDAQFVMPPEELVHPLGAYGIAEPPRPQDVAIINATIWTSGPDGIIENGELEIRDGAIAYVGPIRHFVRERDIPVIDARGKHVTPGLIDCHSHTGISAGVNESGQPNTAEVRIGDVINPDDINFYRQLAGGLTAANQLHGSANPIGGQNSVVKLKWGGTIDDLRIPDAIAGIKFALGENVTRSRTRYPNTRMGVETFIRDAFSAAGDYQAEWDRYLSMTEYERGHTMPPRRDLELDTLVEILNGQRLVHCHSYRQDEILMLIRQADYFGFTIGTFQHVLEGYKVAEAIARHGAGASTFSDWWAYKVEVMDAIPYNGALMHDVGVLVSFNSDSSELARRLNTEAAKAVRYGGVDPAEALKFVTLNPARQLRIDHRTGSLEVGKDADFVIWSEDPLSTYARCEQTWVEGAKYFDLDTDRQRRAWAQHERQRIVQKILADEHGKPSSPLGSDAESESDEQVADVPYGFSAELPFRRKD